MGPKGSRIEALAVEARLGLNILAVLSKAGWGAC